MTNKSDDEPLDVRVIAPITASMNSRIKKFWHRRELSSKSEAIRRLIEVGLQHEERALERQNK